LNDGTVISGDSLGNIQYVLDVIVSQDQTKVLASGVDWEQ